MTNQRVGIPLLPAWLRWAGVAVVAAAIFYFSVITAPPGDPVIEPPSLIPLDKWRHFLAYAAFGGALGYAMVDWQWRTRRLALTVLAVVVVYGVGIEMWQAYLPDRYFGLGDAYANTLGGVLAMPLFLLRDRIPFVPIGELVASVRQ